MILLIHYIFIIRIIHLRHYLWIIINRYHVEPCMLQLYSNKNFNALFVKNLIFTTNMVIRFNEIAIIRNYDLCYVCMIRFVCCIFPFEIRKVKTSSIWLDILIASCFVIRYSKTLVCPVSFNEIKFWPSIQTYSLWTEQH